MRSRQGGFTLIELLIVLTIVAILSAMMIPNLLVMIQRAKQKRAMAEVRGFAMAIGSYSVDTNRAPLGDGSWKDSKTAIPYGELAPMYIKEVPNPDPWYSDYQYAATDTGSDFGLRTLGSEGVADSPDLATLMDVNTPVEHTVCFENDIVWVNSDFMIWPEGKQVRCL